MISRSKLSNIYFGWWMNLVMGITSGLAGGFIQLGASALFKPVAAELGLNRAVASVATSVARLEGGLQAPVTGVLADKFGPKWVVLIGSCMLGIGLVAMNYIDSVWAYYIVWGAIIATGHNLGFTIAHDKVLTDWFISKRGLAFGVRFGLLGLLGVIVLPIVSWLIDGYGWRTTCLIWAVLIFITIPLSMYFIKRNRPEFYGMLPDGIRVETGSETNVDSLVNKGVEYAASFQENEFTLRQALRTPAYWLLTVAWCSFQIAYGAIVLHCIPFLTDLNISSGMAAFMMSLMSFIAIPSRFFAGFLSDRFQKSRLNLLLAMALLIQAIGIAVFLMNQTLMMIYVFLILFGFGAGAMTPLGIAIRGRYFGRKAYGSIQGTSQLFAAPVSLIAPVYAGWVYDQTGNYINAFTVFTIIVTLTGILMFFVRPPKPPTEVTDFRRFM